MERIAALKPCNGHSSPAVRGVVFDLDGLMFNTEALYFQVASEFLARRGKQFTPDLMQLMLGRRAAESVPELKLRAGLIESVDEILLETRTRMAELLETALAPTPGLLTLLDRLCSAGLPHGVATSSRRSYAENLLSRQGLRERFAFVLGAEDVMRGKPDPEIYCTAAARLGVDPRGMLVLEDSAPGLAAARAAGAYAVGVPHEHSPSAGLIAAHLIVPRLDDPRLLSLLA